MGHAGGSRRLLAASTLLRISGGSCSSAGSGSRGRACACVLLRRDHSVAVAAVAAAARGGEEQRHRGGHAGGPWGVGASSSSAAAAGLLLVLAAAATEAGDGRGGRGCAECKAIRNIHDFYKMVEKPIGAGGFGVVCVGAHRETGETVAIKQMPKKAVKEWKVQQEIEILRQAGEHRNIIGFRDMFQDEDNWYIVMEMAEGGELFDRLVEQVGARKWEGRGNGGRRRLDGFRFPDSERYACIHTRIHPNASRARTRRRRRARSCGRSWTRCRTCTSRASCTATSSPRCERSGEQSAMPTPLSVQLTPLQPSFPPTEPAPGDQGLGGVRHAAGGLRLGLPGGPRQAGAAQGDGHHRLQRPRGHIGQGAQNVWIDWAGVGGRWMPQSID